MMLPPPTPEQKAQAERLQKMIDEAAAKFASLSPEDQEEMLRRQRDGWVKAEMSWPRDCPYR